MDIKKEIEDILTSTKREGMANLLAYMESSGFYTALQAQNTTEQKKAR